MNVSYYTAVVSLVGGIVTGPENGPIGEYSFESNQTAPTEEQIQAKIAELQAAEPMRLLRIERNKLLQETDWIATIDYPGTVEVQEQWLDYRQALRDLPANSDPQLDENGNLININWPTQPENS